MINFFRKIRKQHADDNNPVKYLRYALGEITLVVIGILIALQINNLNEERKDRIREQIILGQLMEDYEANLLQLEQKIELRNSILKSAFKVLNIIDNPNEIIRDSLIANTAILIIDPTFDPIQNDLISSGNLRLISNDKLKRLLSNWTSDIVALRELELIWSQITYKELQPVLTRLGISRDIVNSFWNDFDQSWLLDKDANSVKTSIGLSKLNVPAAEIIANKELEGLVSLAISYNKAANLQSEALHKRINEILSLIENEIN
jgi:hypothetical protein